MCIHYQPCQLLDHLVGETPLRVMASSPLGV